MHKESIYRKLSEAADRVVSRIIDDDELFGTDDDFNPVENATEDASSYTNHSKLYGRLLDKAREFRAKGMVLTFICNDGSERESADVASDVRFLRLDSDMLNGNDGQDNSIVISTRWQQHFDEINFKKQTFKYGGQKWLSDYRCSEVMSEKNENEAEMDFNGYGNTLELMRIVSDEGKDCLDYMPAVSHAYGTTEMLCGHEVHGYLPALGQLKVLSDNMGMINDVLALLSVDGLHVKGGSWWSSAESSYLHAWELCDGKTAMNTKGMGAYVLPLFHLPRKRGNGTDALLEAIGNGIAKAIDGDDMFDTDDTVLNPIEDVVEDASMYVNHGKMYSALLRLAEAYPLKAVLDIDQNSTIDTALTLGKEFEQAAWHVLETNRNQLEDDCREVVVRYSLLDVCKVLGLRRYMEYVKKECKRLDENNDMFGKVEITDKHLKLFETRHLQSVWRESDILYSSYKAYKFLVVSLIDHMPWHFNMNWIDIDSVMLSDYNGGLSAMYNMLRFRNECDITMRLRFTKLLYEVLDDVSEIGQNDRDFYDRYVKNISTKDNALYACYQARNKANLQHVIERFTDQSFFGNEANLNWIDVSAVTDMSMLMSKTLFDFNGDISLWDVSNVKTMDHMFYNSNFAGDLSKWRLRNDCDIKGMFKQSNVNIVDVTRFFTNCYLNENVSNAIDGDDMFDFNGDFDVVENDTEDSSVYSNQSKECMRLTQMIRNGWTVDNLQNAYSNMTMDERDFIGSLNVRRQRGERSDVIEMFSKNGFPVMCRYIFCIYPGIDYYLEHMIGDSSMVADIMDMAVGTNSRSHPLYAYARLERKTLQFILNTMPMKSGYNLNWVDVSGINDMSALFKARWFVMPDISLWDTTNVRNMDDMFAGSRWRNDNKGISEWDVSNVASMSNMFCESNYNGYLGKWRISDECDCKDMFKDCPIDDNNKPPRLRSGLNEDWRKALDGDEMFDIDDMTLDTADMDVSDASVYVNRDKTAVQILSIDSERQTYVSMVKRGEPLPRDVMKLISKIYNHADELTDECRRLIDERRLLDFCKWYMKFMLKRYVSAILKQSKELDNYGDYYFSVTLTDELSDFEKLCLTPALENNDELLTASYPVGYYEFITITDHLPFGSNLGWMDIKKVFKDQTYGREIADIYSRISLEDMTLKLYLMKIVFLCLMEKYDMGSSCDEFYETYMDVKTKDDRLYAAYHVNDKLELKMLIENFCEDNGFGGNANLNWLDISAIDDMSELFTGLNRCFFNGDISLWDVSHVKDMTRMFKDSAFSGDITHWCVGSDCKTDEMFHGSEVPKRNRHLTIK